MSASTKAPRTSADVSADLEQRRAREAELGDKLAAATRDLTDLRAERARGLVDGAPGPTPSKIAALAEEVAGLSSALDLLASDITTLEAEASAAEIREAAETERGAISEATRLAEEVDELVRSLAETEIIPLADRLMASLSTARKAENAHNRLQRLADPDRRDVFAERAEKAIHRRGPMMELLAALRRYTGETDAKTRARGADTVKHHDPEVRAQAMGHV